MLTREQIILIKQAQRQAGLCDADYRGALRDCTGFAESSKDPLLTDAHFDRVLAYFEAIYWQGVAAGKLPRPARGAPFQRPDYWRHKNCTGANSRERFATRDLLAELAALENLLLQLGCNAFYCAAIKRRVTAGDASEKALWRYRAALQRTLQAKRAKVAQPF